jgi:hypothetical protein
VQACSTRVNEETFPLGSIVTYHFPARDATPQANNCHVQGLSGPGAGGVAMPPLKLVWYDGGLRPPRPEGLEDEQVMGDNGRLLIGDNGFLLGTRLYPESRRKDFPQPPRTIPRLPPPPRRGQEHYTTWSGLRPARAASRRGPISTGPGRWPRRCCWATSPCASSSARR